jgi:enamine deaminase RidA (YjgF/YER057c/UK114 family)
VVLEREFAIRLPPARKMANPNRTGVVQAGRLLFVSGHAPVELEGVRRTGKVGADLTLEEGYRAAQACAVGILSTLREYLGDLDRVRRVVKLVGFVNSAPGFLEQPAVVDGASDVFYKLWGDAGSHARSAIGVFELPRGIAVEVEGVLEVDSEGSVESGEGKIPG